MVLLLFVFGFAAVRLVSNAPAKPIEIHTSNLNAAQLQSLKQATQAMGDVQFFSVDLANIHQAVSKLSWVESASVVRDWQKGVLVSVVPRQAVANFGSEHMIDAAGTIFVPADEHELMNHKLVNLYGDAEMADAIMRQMQRVNEWFAPLGLTAKDVILTPRQTWVIRFNNGLRVIVDHENTEQKLHTLAALLGGNLKNDLPKMQSVDLRYKNGFAVAWKSGSK
ncbi:cell division protein FtsQ [Moraxella caviae]|nr:cell division protein FtsQ [Moraxella caviae]